jgi:hypothetical protein
LNLNTCGAVQDHGKILAVWQQLLVNPVYTLAAAGCLRGSLLAVASSLVGHIIHQDAGAQITNYQEVATALMRVQELHSSIHQ